MVTGMGHERKLGAPFVTVKNEEEVFLGHSVTQRKKISGMQQPK